MHPTDRLTLTPPRDDHDVRRLSEIIYQSFAGFGLPPERTDAWLATVGNENVRVARLDGEIVGGLGIYYFGHYFGGRAVPAAGITIVGISPEVRGTGVAARMMGTCVTQLRDAGCPLSSLYPSTYGLYRKVGYEQAGVRIWYKLALRAIGRPSREARIRPMTTADHPAVAAIYETRARRTAGNVARTQRQWDRIFADWDGRVYAYVVEAADAATNSAARLEGYIVYIQAGQRNQPYEIIVRDCAALTRPAAQRLLALLADHSTMASHAQIVLGIADPVLALAEEENLTVHNRSLWMLRVIDARAALEARGYSPAIRAELHFRLRDELIANNDGDFILTVAEGRGQVRPGGRGDVQVDIRGLAPLYTGHQTAEELQTTGQVCGSAEALASASAVFAGPAPWMGERY